MLGISVRLVVLILAVALSAACSTSSKAPPTIESETKSDHQADKDKIGQDDGEGEDVLDLNPWKDDADGGFLDVEADAAPQGLLGDDCGGAEDCLAGMCLKGPDGGVCTDVCMDDCPAGWTCASTDIFGGDMMFVCFPTDFDKCKPCAAHTECGTADDYCIQIGDEGKFCGLDCATLECPEGYICKEVAIPDLPKPVQQCVPVTGSCTCNQKHGGDEKPCKNTNDYGTCTGTAVCDPKEGWGECGAAMPAPEDCNGVDDNCNGTLDEGFADGDGDQVADCVDEDDDNDGDPDTADCAPLDPSIYHGAPEPCDGVDNNCNKEVDEGELDTDNDGVPDCADEDDDNDGVLDPNDNCQIVANPDQTDSDEDTVGDACDMDDDNDGILDLIDNCPLVKNLDQLNFDDDGQGDACDDDKDGDGDGALSDCDDLNPAVHVGASEECDGLDNNCNGELDEGSPDTDLDGLKNCSDKDDDGDADPDETDCAPLDGTVFHGAMELCNGKDDDCNKKVDEGFPDTNNDGVPDCAPGSTDDDGDGDPDVTDCAPQDPNIYHNAIEKCDQLDNNCNEQVDESFPDSDSDGVADCIDTDDDNDGIKDTKDNCPTVPNVAQGNFDKDKEGDACDDDDDNDGDPDLTDCASLDPEAFHGALEICNYKDDNCDIKVDEENAQGCSTFYFDSDNDGFGNTAKAKCLCDPFGNYKAAVGGDCNDTNIIAFPGAAEICNTSDDDCDGEIDEKGATGCLSFYEDKDKDGYGTGLPTCICKAQGNTTAMVSGDCNDNAATAYPGSPEICDNLDNDCDMQIDENAGGCLTYYSDVDKDGFGKSADFKCICNPTGNYSTLFGGDCDDSNAETSPGAKELCDGKDNTCNFLVDEGFPDSNQDGIADCIGEDDDSDGKMDVDDNCPQVYNPDQLNSDTDKDGDACDPDDDNDGTLDAADCAPKDKDAYPGATEKCNEKDDDCDTLIDEEGATGCSLLYKDKDDDDYGMVGQSKCLCGPYQQFTAAQAGDCDDSSWAVHPGATEVCNGADDDCDGIKDNENAQGCKPLYQDADADSYGVTTTKKCLCANTGEWTAFLQGDCDDTNPDINPIASEACDFVDNDCDGKVDEGTGSTCGNCDPTCHQTDVGQGGDEAFDPNDENSSGVATGEDGSLVMSSEEVKLAYLWVANSGENTVSKIDTVTGKEAGRYAVCANPSRTAVDLYGDVWAACRNDGAVAKISVYEKNCIDKNKDGKIQTSKDLNNSGKIESNEMYPKGQDECLLLLAYPGGSIQRSVGVDKANNAWVGEWNGMILRKLNAISGQVMDSISINPTRPYGLVIDGNGIIWISGREQCYITRVDPATKQVKHYAVPSCCGSLYGIAVDINGKVWVANSHCNGNVYKFDPVTSAFSTVVTNWGYGYTRGVAASLDGYVYFGHHTWTCQNGRWITKIDVNTNQVVAVFATAGSGVTGVTGVALDYDNNLWGINQCTNSVTKINATTGAVIGTYSVGSAPYTYSDMTGYSLKSYTAPKGFYQHIIPGGSVGSTTWTELSVDFTANGKSYIEVKLRSADTVAGLNVTDWVGPYGPFPPNAFPLDLSNLPGLKGKYLQVEFGLFADDDGQTPLIKAFSAQYYDE